MINSREWARRTCSHHFVQKGWDCFRGPLVRNVLRWIFQRYILLRSVPCTPDPTPLFCARVCRNAELPSYFCDDKVTPCLLGGEAQIRRPMFGEDFLKREPPAHRTSHHTPQHFPPCHHMLHTIHYETYHQASHTTLPVTTHPTSHHATTWANTHITSHHFIPHIRHHHEPCSTQHVLHSTSPTTTTHCISYITQEVPQAMSHITLLTI